MKFGCCAAALLALVALSTSALASPSDVPVIIWGKPSVTYVPALSQYTTAEFAALLESQTDAGTFTVVFAEERLSTEDLAQCKLKTQTCFRNLAKVERKSYLPSVQEPMATFGGDFEDIQSVQLAGDGSLSERIVPKAGSIVVVNLSGDDFASHDALIDGLYNRLRAEFPNLLAVYTGKTPSFRYSSLIRRTRQAEPTVPNDVLQIPNTFMMYYEKFEAGPVGGPLTAVVFNGVTKEDANSSDTTLQVNLSGPAADLRINFALAQGNWQIMGVTYNQVPYYLRHRVDINQHFSYRCNDMRYVTPDMKNEIVLTEVQLQPHWQKQDEPDFVKFGDAWNCVGFTTPGILTGLFLVFIFIFIGAYGITWMMDIRTMDRFDDPKGKTITVNTAGD
ncbi:hypothetical protein quinque_001446 [Culex quinquefasciatus]|uniref:V-type proton ATPase subunit S1 n=1 Tax=Culex quinquefasciatus TaxID=7176 RepID=UPI0018E3039F|nr:V-type proton ATPase subunit S1 [Culex quinquefasciatus]